MFVCLVCWPLFGLFCTFPSSPNSSYLKPINILMNKKNYDIQLLDMFLIAFENWDFSLAHYFRHGTVSIWLHYLLEVYKICKRIGGQAYLEADNLDYIDCLRLLWTRSSLSLWYLFWARCTKVGLLKSGLTNEDISWVRFSLMKTSQVWHIHILT